MGMGLKTLVSMKFRNPKLHWVPKVPSAPNLFPTTQVKNHSSMALCLSYQPKGAYLLWEEG
jgi:hypothetical protein